jgi:hypothetical protein
MVKEEFINYLKRNIRHRILTGKPADKIVHDTEALKFRQKKSESG